MPRPLRLHVPGAMYHVTLRGNHRQDIFFCPQDRELLSDLIAEVAMRFEARIHAYCYMTNHIHLLIQVSDAPLGRLMLRIAGRYAWTIQRRIHTTGHLFEKRYYPVLVDVDAYLLELIRYIHLNPVRADLVASPNDYPWSSHHVYMGRREEAWVTTEFALSLFHSQIERAVSAYRLFVGAQLGRQTSSPLSECNSSDRRVLGGDDFAARMLGKAWSPRSRKTLDDIVAEACAQFAVSPDQLCSTSRATPLVQARAYIASQATKLRVASIAGVARHLRRDESSLRHGVQRYFRDA